MTAYLPVLPPGMTVGFERKSVPHDPMVCGIFSETTCAECLRKMVALPLMVEYANATENMRLVEENR